MTKLTSAVALTAVAIAVTAPSTIAQTTPRQDTASPLASSCGCELGGGMMGGNGPGHGAYGRGMMMGGGPGMIAGGHGPGMMGGHGLGMTDGRGFGMMGEGPGMMGMRMYAAIDLTDQQRAKIARIFEDARKKNWDAIGRVMDESATLRDLYNAPTRDPAAIGRQTVKIAELRRPIIESMVMARDQIDALLTTEQKDRLRSIGRGRMMSGE